MVVRDLDERTTIQVLKCDKELFNNTIPGNYDYEKFYKLLDFYIRNYNVNNVEWMSREINKQIKAALKEK